MTIVIVKSLLYKHIYPLIITLLSHTALLPNYFRAYASTADVAVKIARALGVSVEYLVAGEENPIDRPSLGPEIRGLIQNYKLLCEDDRKMIIAIIQLYKNKRNKK